MKICFLSSMHPARDKRVFEKEAVSLAAAGFDVTHLCPGTEADAGTFSGVRIVIYPRRKGLAGRIGQFRDLYRRAKQLDADVYHCNEVDSWVIGVLLRVLRRKRCVFDVHEHYPSTFAESRFPPRLRPLVAALVRVGFRFLTPFTDRIIAAKRSVAGDFPNASGKLLLVQNFTPVAAIRWAADRAFGDGSRPVTLIHLGLFSKVRGWPQVLDALAAMRDKTVRLEIVGEINDGTRPELEQRVADLGLSGRVMIREWMPFREAFGLLCRADIGLVTFQPGILNHVYAMPHKMFDYMAAGLAVVCPSFAEEVAPIVSESRCGVLVDPSNSRELGAALDRLASSPEMRREMGQRGQQAVREWYNWEVEAEKLIHMYQSWQVAAR